MKTINRNMGRLLFQAMCLVTVIGWLGCKSSASASGPVDPSRDGSSFEKAVIIQSRSESAGVSAEYRWLDAHYPGYTRGKQSLRFSSGHPYDQLDITTPDGHSRSVLFDITSFFGK